MKKCKHRWVGLLATIPEWKQAALADRFLLSLKYPDVDRYLFCEHCGRSGHTIRSGRGGIRLHRADAKLRERIKVVVIRILRH